jgi:uncharacterized protein YdbL (DUF1318 family)
MKMLLLLFPLLSCSFNFEVTSQRTALENQIMGSYEELDNDVIMLSSVRAVDESGKKKELSISELQEEAIRARQNQDFNRDDIDEFKDLHVLGESNDGLLVILDSNIGKYSSLDEENKKFVSNLCDEENKDRKVVWSRIIQNNENLKENDISEVRKTFAKMQFDASKKGHWVQEQDGRWVQK